MRQLGICLHARRELRLRTVLPRTELIHVGPGHALPAGCRLDGLVLDPCASGIPDATGVLAIQRRFVAIPTLIYTEFDAAVAPALLQLGRCGLTRVLLERIDDGPVGVRAALLDLQREAPKACAMTMLLEAFATLPGELLTALEELQQLPAVVQTVEQLADIAGITRRRLERICLAVDAPSPSLLIGFLRLFEAHRLLQDTSGPAMVWVSNWLGYSSMRILRKQSKAWLGCTVGGLRELTGVEVVDRAARWRPSAQAVAAATGGRIAGRLPTGRVQSPRDSMAARPTPDAPAYAFATALEIDRTHDAVTRAPRERHRPDRRHLAGLGGAQERATLATRDSAVGDP